MERRERLGKRPEFSAFDKVQKRTYTHIVTLNCGRILIAYYDYTDNLDVLDLYFGIKNVHLGVNGNPARIELGIEH